MRGVLLLLVGLGAAGLSRLASSRPAAVEAVYGSWLGPSLARWLSLLTGWIPLSVVLVGIVALLLWVGVRILGGIRRIRRGKTTVGKALGRGGAWTAAVAGVVLLAFYVGWGFNYARAPLETRLALDTIPAGPAALTELARHAVEEVNRAYVELHDTVDAGAPTATDLGAARLSRAMRPGWQRVAPALGMAGYADRPYGPVKTLGATPVLQAFDLLGVYSPFTGEAHVNGAAPAMVVAGTVGHEQAHQRTITHEGEATFVGALAAIHTDNALLRYGGWARVLRSVLRDLARADRDARATAQAALHPGVLRDWRDFSEWAARSRSPAGPVASAVNDRYLRSQGVPGGVANYALDTRLLVAWFVRNGDSLLLDVRP